MRLRGGPILAAVMAAVALLVTALPGTVAARDPEPLPGAMIVSVGQTHACALWWHGLSCWGDNDGGLLGNGTGSGTLAAPIAPPMVEPQSVVAPRPPERVTVFAAVDAGPESTCAIATGQGDSVAGTLWCWGDSYSPLGRRCVGGDIGGAQDPGVVMAGPPGPDGSDTECGTPLQDVVRVAVGGSRACAIVRQDPSALAGEVWCWGRGETNELLATAFPGPDGGVLAGIVDLDASGGRFCALTEDGAVLCWSDAATRVLGPDVTIAPAVAIAVGVDHTCAQTDDGGVWCWGANAVGQLGDGTTTASSVPVRVIGLDGTAASRVSALDELPYGPRLLAAGDRVTCVLRDHAAGTPRGADTVWCWGANDRGQLGDGSRDARGGAVRVTGLEATEGLFDVAVGGSTACVVTGEETRSAGTDPTMGGLITSQALRCWGANEHGQLGAGDWSDRSAPTLVVMTDEPRLRE